MRTYLTLEHAPCGIEPSSLINIESSVDQLSGRYLELIKKLINSVSSFSRPTSDVLVNGVGLVSHLIFRPAEPACTSSSLMLVTYIGKVPT